MANGRFLSKSISTSEQLASVSLEADYLFTRCIPHLDVEGRLLGSARWLKSQVVPMRDEITVEKIPRLIEELAAATDHVGRPLVECYEIGGRQFLAFPGFLAHQQGLRANREAPSKIPAPPGGGCEEPPSPAMRVDAPSAPLPDNSGSTPGALPEDSGLSGREVKVSQAEAVRAREEPTPASAQGPERAPNPAAPLSLRDEFVRRYYALATPQRLADVHRQLDAVLTPAGSRVSKTERAVATTVTLEKALREMLDAGAVRVPDKAIVVLLRKLISGRCNETRPPGLPAAAPPQLPRTRGACASLGALVAGPPATPSPAADPITPEDRSEALSWVAQHPERLQAIEAWADIEAARVHPRWRDFPRMAAVRARNVEEALVGAFREARALSPISQTLGAVHA